MEPAAVQKAHWKNQLNMVDWQPSELHSIGVITPLASFV